MSNFDGVQLALFSHKLSAICDEMGAILRRAAFSPNIKDRLDFSCAIFDVEGQLCAQAAHIPVHLGSMAYAMAGIVAQVTWQPGDMLVVNDPYLGGTHLPDVTMIKPVFIAGELIAFVANRAHHANIGASSPGSMPVSSSLLQEGLLIEPSLLIRDGQYQQPLWRQLCGLTEADSGGDFIAQISTNIAGSQRLSSLIEQGGFTENLQALNDYGERLALARFRQIPDGEFCFEDVMDDDGQGTRDILIQLKLTFNHGSIIADFSGTADQVAGNINCPLSVAAAAVYYVFRCLLPSYVPNCAGLFRPIQITAPSGSLVNAQRPHAVAAGNVETSSRIVDVTLGALAQVVPDLVAAASYGTMNNVAMGSDMSSNSDNQQQEASWSYYETIGGGGGASAKANGLNAVQCHMTNTLNTPIESLETHYPLRIHSYQLHEGSGGDGAHSGGDGIIREYQLLQPATVTLLTERRRHQPWGLLGGEAASVGINLLNGKGLPAKCERKLKAGDILTIKTPGGGGWNQQT